MRSNIVLLRLEHNPLGYGLKVEEEKKSNYKALNRLIVHLDKNKWLVNSVLNNSLTIIDYVNFYTPREKIILANYFGCGFL